jgi:hypothetical protein
MNVKFKDFFAHELNPDVLGLPIFIFQVKSPETWLGLPDKLTETTGQKLAQWPSKPWYDRNGNGDYPLRNENLSHSEWANPHNQKQLRCQDYLGLLVPAEIPEPRLRELLPVSPEEDEKTFVNKLPEIVFEIGWLLYELNEDWMLFVASKAHRSISDGLKAWCLGHDVIVVAD